MHEYIRILQTGEIDTDKELLQFVAAENIPFCEPYPHQYDTDEPYCLAREHGAVCFEVDINYDRKEIYHQEDEVDDFGFDGTMTYAEYWKLHPDERMERPQSCWQLWILLQVKAPIMHLRSPIHEKMLVARFVGDENDAEFFLAMTLVQTNCWDQEEVIFQPDPQQPLVLSPGKISAIVLENGIEEQSLKWQFGETATLTAYTNFPNIPLALRKWAWAWKKTCGPVYLYLFLYSSIGQTHTFLHNLREEVGTCAKILVR
jgi:hypothetical protein